MPPKVIIFDFDGTLVDSNLIKIEAFSKCFSSFSEKLPEIMSYCRSHHHTPRFDKFRFVFKNILRKPYTMAIEKELLEKYESATTEQVVAAEEIPGATFFLEKNSQVYEMGLLSSTPHPILLKILERRQMKHYFRYIQGAPVNKADWLRKFREGKGFSTDDIIFIGDTKEDAESARKANVAFIDVERGRFFQNGC